VVLLVPLPERTRPGYTLGEFHNHVLVDGRLGQVDFWTDDGRYLRRPGIELPTSYGMENDAPQRRDA
jgi:hypothetical protein